MQSNTNEENSIEIVIKNKEDSLSKNKLSVDEINFCVE